MTYNIASFVNPNCTQRPNIVTACPVQWELISMSALLLSGEPDYFGRNKISSGGDLSHYSSASLY